MAYMLLLILLPHHPVSRGERVGVRENKNSPPRRRAVLVDLYDLSALRCFQSVIQMKSSRPSHEKWAADDGYAAIQMDGTYWAGFYYG
jgi:hypothetical protein